MKDKSLIFLYFKSNLNLVLLLVTTVLALNIIIFGTGITRVFLILGTILLYAVASVILFFTKQGAKEIVNEREKDRLLKVKEKIIFYKQIRDRISFLRIGDEDVRKAIEYFLINIGNYLNKCSEVSSYSPQANRRIEEVLEVCQVYLEKLDQSSIDTRYKTESKEFADYKERTINIIKDAASFIKNKMTGELIGLTPEEKIEIIEEMNKE